MKLTIIFITVCLFVIPINAQHILPKLPICKEVIDTSLTIDSLIAISKQTLIKNPLKSVCYLSEAKNKAKTKKEKILVAQKANRFSLSLYSTADYIEAIFVTSLSAQIWYELDNIKAYNNSLRKIGNYYFFSGDIYNAVNYSTKALVISKKNNFKTQEYQILYRLAWCHWRIGNCDQAIKYIELSKELIDNGSVSRSLKLYYKSISNFYHCKGMNEEALKYVDLSIAISKVEKDYLNLSIVTSFKANYLIEMNGNQEEIFEMLNQVINLNKRADNKTQLGLNYITLSKAYLYINNYQKAIEASLISLEYVEKIGDLPKILENYNYLKQAYKKNNNLSNAFLYSEKYNKLYEQIYGVENLKKIFEIQQEHNEEINKGIIKNLKITNQQNKRIYWLTSIIVLLLFSGILIYFIQSKKNQKLKNEALKEQLTHELLQMEMEALRSRMNPHFIFNSLNSIKSFIISNDVKNSITYFSKFAKLLRYSLNNSSIDFVNLEDEITFLNDYVILENLRLTHPFEFIIESVDNLDLKSLQIPPLIIQTFVENAIWHGLSLKKDNGKLRLKITSKNNFLEIHIIDNGIGRKASAIINKNKTHSSKGISITTKRLAIFSKIYNFQKSFEIIDLIDENGKAKGTKIIIKLPLLYKSDLLMKSKLLT